MKIKEISCRKRAAQIEQTIVVDFTVVAGSATVTVVIVVVVRVAAAGLMNELRD